MSIKLARCKKELRMQSDDHDIRFTEGNVYEVLRPYQDGYELLDNAGIEHGMPGAFWTYHFEPLWTPLEEHAVSTLTKRYGYVRMFSESEPHEAPILCENGCLHDTPAAATESMKPCFDAYGRENYKLAVIAWAT